MSFAPHKEVLFAIGALRAHGLSEEYARVIAERILVPGADLGPSDLAYLKIVRLSMQTLTVGMGRRVVT